MKRLVRRARVPLSFAALALAAACGGSLGGGSKTVDRPAVELGDALFHDHSLSPSVYNRFACSTCHATTPDEPADVTLSGYTLYDSANRADWFLGYSEQYLDAVNFCLVYFMRGEAIVPGDPNGDALYEYLASISPDGTAPELQYTFERVLPNIPRGDADHGKELYDRTCRICHGDKDTGSGRISPETTILNATLSADYDTLFPGTPHDSVVIEKIRHGQFYGIGGNMPFFTQEKLSDADVGDLLAYLDI